MSNTDINPLRDLYKPFVEFLILYPYIKNYRTNIQLGLAKEKIKYIFPNWDKVCKIMTGKRKSVSKKIRDAKEIVNEVYCFTKDKDSLLLSFTYHIRNAIAHGEIKCDENYVVLKDNFFNKQTGKLSKCNNAYIRIEKQRLLMFLNFIITNNPQP